MPEWLIAVVAGVVEGITEFLPISSTGHLIITADILQFDSIKGTFEIFIQLGAVVAVILFYRAELWQQAKQLISSDADENLNPRQLWIGVAIAFIPAATVGILFNSWINDFLFNSNTVAIALIVGGVMFILVEKYFVTNYTEDSSIETHPLTYRQSLIVGFWQVLALIPGMSRSGMSIIGGMFAGLDRKRATQFSFYLAMPTLGAATIYTLLLNLSTISPNELMLLGVGTIVSGVVAWFSIGWLLRYVATNDFILFGYYRILVGVVILILSL